MIFCTRQRLMFMTHFRLPPNRDSHVHHHNAVLASLLVLLTVSAGCSSDRETGTAPSKDRPRKQQEPEPEPADAGMQCPAFSDDYFDEFKACASDDECELIEVISGCSTQRDVYGVTKASREEIDRCLPSTDGLPECSNSRILRMEDGRVASNDLHDVHARCIRGKCRSRVEDRQCGEGSTCTGIQLCISYQDGMGVTQFRCLDNLCGDTPLDCSCAESLCVVPGDAMRMCATDQIVASDVYCKTVRR